MRFIRLKPLAFERISKNNILANPYLDDDRFFHAVESRRICMEALGRICQEIASHQQASSPSTHNLPVLKPVYDSMTDAEQVRCEPHDI